ncbi:MAG TPA: AraC family ligand binding domain-containing protein [Candidatus Mediterraneibacter merdipullorum]|nr:AraC family ligand binding domain-containing protein [Candidatus Mediterraneibacter merdipullorum]
MFREFPPGGNLFLIAHYVNEPYPRHRHDYYELNYIYRGTLINEIDGRKVHMTAGDLVIMNRSASHSLTPLSDNCLLLNICIRRELFRRLLRPVLRVKSPLKTFFSDKSGDGLHLFYPLLSDRKCQVMLSSILQIYSANRFRETPELEHLFIRFFTVLGNSEEYSVKGPDETSFGILNALREDCLSSLADIAAKLKTPEADIIDLVHTDYGRSAFDVLSEERIKHAAEMLADRKMSLYIVAGKCGYQNVWDFAARQRVLAGSVRKL